MIEKYMSSIYNMVTINHDQLLSTIFNNLSDGEINEFELKCMCYFAVYYVKKTGKYFLHEGLKRNLIHLLTDDRFHEYKNFIKLAIETSILENENNRLIKDSSRIPVESEIKFHSIRKLNTLTIIANELEPFNNLQEYILHLSQINGDDLIKKIVDHLMNRAIDQIISIIKNITIRMNQNQKKWACRICLKVNRELKAYY